MDTARSLWLVLPKQLRKLPADLATMVILVVVTNTAVFVPVIRETPLRVPIGLAFVLFVPGYAFIAALFPEQGDGPATAGKEDDGPSSRDGIDGIERVALSFGLSIAIVPLIGLVLNFTPWGIRLTPIMIALSGFTVCAIGIAAHRRWQLPEDEQFRVPYRHWIGATREELFNPASRVDGALNIILILSILLATGSVVYAVAVPQQGEQFSELYVLTENDDGELVADNYPEAFVQGERQELVLGIENNEHKLTNYTVVVVEQRVEIQGNETIVRQQQELRRFETQLAHNETWHHPHEIAPTILGNNTRVQWLLYLGDEVPQNITEETADYSIHLWVNVRSSS